MDRLLWRVAISLLQGLLLWWLYHSVETDSWPATDRGWLIGLIAPAVLVPAAHFLIVDVGDRRRGLWVLLPLALALFGLGWHHGAWTSNDPQFDSTFAFSLALVVLVFHALPFVQGWLASGRWKPAYEELFQYAWRNTLLLAFGGVFSGVFWLLLWLWGALFKMLGITFFVDLFTEAYFAIPATAVALGLGMHLVGSVERLQTLLRQQLLAMLKWLAPLAILILALFTVTLLVKSPELLLEQRRVISAAWLLWLVALTVSLLNAAYQDGRSDSPYPRWLGNAIRCLVPLLVVIAVLASYALLVRAQSYGLTVARTWGLLVAAIALAYAGGYAWAALRRGAWMAGMGAVNVWVALGTIALLTLMLTPIASPERLAAASQYARVLADPDGDSYRYLRFNSGRYGRDRLERLAKLADHPAATKIQAAVAREQAKENPWEAPRRAALPADIFEVFPAGQAVEPKLLTALHESGDRHGLDACTETEPCPLLFIDLNRDGVAEALIFAAYATYGAERSADGWEIRNQGQGFGGYASPADRKTLRKALAQGRYSVRDPDWQTFEINGRDHVFEKRHEPPCAKETAPD